tara:strand:+ start:234 stop:572 length:339 start_codon:yes stop_codon:yes gene_type:complete
MLIIENIDKLKEFIKENKLVLLLFSATWCGPCKMLKQKILEEDEKILKGIQLGYCDIDNEQLAELVDFYKILSMPTLIFISLDSTNIKEIKRIVGYDLIAIEMYINDLVNIV